MHYFRIFDKPFLRLWDHCSGSQPDEDGCTKSRAERERLDTNMCLRHQPLSLPLATLIGAIKSGGEENAFDAVPALRLDISLILAFVLNPA